MRSPVLPLTVSRMGAYRLVLAAAAVSTLITAALVAALASFSGQALGQAALRQIASSPGTTFVVSGQTTSGQAVTQTAAIRARMRSVFGPAGFALYHADWSGLLRLPARYATPGNTPITQAAALTGIARHAVLQAGSWPAAPRAGQPIPVALPAAAAALLHVSVGDLLPLREQVSGQSVRARVTGVFAPDVTPGHTSAFWQLNLVSASGVSRAGGFATYGPLVVNQAALGAALPVGEGSWAVAPVAADITRADMTAMATQVSAYAQTLSSGGLQVQTGLPALLHGIASNQLVARSLLVVAGVLLLLLAGFTLASVARLLATDREAESALLTSRGSSRWQLTRLTIPEITLLAIASAVAGGLAGGWLATWLARTGPLRTAGLRLQAVNWDVAGGIVVTAAFATAILLTPAMRIVAPGAARVRRGRQATIAGLARSGADLALVVLAGLAIWQLRHSLIVAPSANGTAGINPVMTLAPALAVTAGTIILMRLLPLAAKVGDRFASRGARLPLSLASWQIARHPVRQAGVALLVVMAVATGTLALSEHQSWLRSAQDQADFTAGANVRVDTPAAVSPAQAAAIVTAPGVRHAMAAAPTSAGGAEVLAIDARQAAGVVLIRRDQTRLASQALFRTITPSGGPQGAVLAGHPSAVSLDVSVGPASLRLGQVAAVVTVADNAGVVTQITAGTLPADGRPHVLTAAFGPRSLPAAAYPLRLTAVSLSYVMPPRRPAGGAVLRLLRLAEPGSGWSAPGSALGGWEYSATSADLTGIETSQSGLIGAASQPSVTSWQAAAGGTQDLSFSTGFGLGVPPPSYQPQPPFRLDGLLALAVRPSGALPLPAIVTTSFAKANSIGVGSVAQASLDGLNVPVRIVAEVATFPTVPQASQAIVVDLPALQDYLAARSVPPLPVTEWWLDTRGASADLAGRLPGGSGLTTSAGVASGLLGDSLSAVPQQALLATALVAALLAITGFCVSIAASVSQRRSQSALLSALGVASGAQAGQLCLEEFMLSLPAAAVGLGLGAFVATLFVPATTLTADATKPFPPVIIEIPWPAAALLAVVVAVLPVLAAAVSAARRPDPAGTLRTAESA
jgi:FtsX-like permease family